MRRSPSHPRSIWEHSKRFEASCVARASGREPEMDSVRQAGQILSTLFEHGARVLDVGSAAGHAARTLTRLGFNYSGIDRYARAIEIGRLYRQSLGIAASDLRVMALEDLPVHERYDAILCLNTLLYFPDFQQPLEIMATAARRALVVRSSFAERTHVRYLPDLLLEPGFEMDRAYFSIFARSDVERFLVDHGFDVTWVEDQRQQERFDGLPEVVGGIALPADFLVALRR